MIGGVHNHTWRRRSSKYWSRTLHPPPLLHMKPDSIHSKLLSPLRYGFGEKNAKLVVVVFAQRELSGDPK